MAESSDRVVSTRDFQAMRDIADGLIEAADGVPLGRVADVLLIRGEDGEFRCTAILMGPEALAGRIATRCRSWLNRLFHGRFEHQIDIAEVEEFGPTLKLRNPSGHYEVGNSEQWVIEHIIRFIPGNGRNV